MGRQLAVVFNSVVLEAVTIRQPVLGGSGRIAGSFSEQSANEFVAAVRAGELFTPVKIVDQRPVAAN